MKHLHHYLHDQNGVSTGGSGPQSGTFTISCTLGIKHSLKSFYCAHYINNEWAHQLQQHTTHIYSAYCLLNTVTRQPVPLFHQESIQYGQCTLSLQTHMNRSAQLIPQVLNRIQVRQACWAFHTRDLLLLQVGINDPGMVWLGIIFLE